ncbi:hypothetical protein B0I75DRAFT_129974 [Yarrowia lipolytica]|nr:hypothetical protein B0I74DRAFT_129849 [Yarrowia lipolytica]RDW51204.1 hypothetical protein B0I75DRAFT_129974 [Yarrowia lipolytica]
MGKGSQLWGLWIQLCGRFRRLWLFPSIVAFPFSGELLVADVDHHFLCHTDTLNQCRYHRETQSEPDWHARRSQAAQILGHSFSVNRNDRNLRRKVVPYHIKLPNQTLNTSSKSNPKPRSDADDFAPKPNAVMTFPVTQTMYKDKTPIHNIVVFLTVS